MTYSDAAFFVCLAAGAASLVRFGLSAIGKPKAPSFTDYIAPFDQAEQEARQRGDTRAIGKARRERKEAVHKALERPA
jgi:hypothetical protein